MPHDLWRASLDLHGHSQNEGVEQRDESSHTSIVSLYRSLAGQKLTTGDVVILPLLFDPAPFIANNGVLEP